jgi:uncharacterized protein (TIGR02597 family)
MKPQFLLHLVPLALGLSLTGAFAQSATSPAIGFVKMSTEVGGDTPTSVPFERRPVYVGVVSAFDDTSKTVTLQGAALSTSPQIFGLNGAQYSHYIHFTTGALAGEYHPLTGNGTDTVTLDTGESLAALTAEADNAKVIPFWTLDTLFPGGEGITGSTSLASSNTALLMWPSASSGTNVPPSFVYSYFSPLSIWVEATTGITDQGGQIIAPDMPFVVRENGSTTNTLVFSGRVPKDPITINISTSSTEITDNPIALFRPVGSTLNQSGLLNANGTSNGAFEPSTSLVSPVDTVLIFDDNATGPNKAPSFVYSYFQPLSRWVEATDGIVDKGDVPIFDGGKTFFIRKGIADGMTKKWTNQANY